MATEHDKSRRKFGAEEDGSVAVWFAILLVPMLGFTFGAIRYAEWTQQRNALLDAMDASALAMARRIDFEGLDACTLADPETPAHEADLARMKRFALEYFAQNYPGHGALFADKKLSRAFDPAQDLTYDLDCDAAEVIGVTADAYTDMGGILGRYFGVGSLPHNAASEVSLAGSGKIELALILDVTGSMSECANASGTCGGSRMSVLKSAVSDMLDDLFGEDETSERIKVGVVPFASSVNIAPDEWYEDEFGNVTTTGKAWMDTEAKSFWHGSNFMHVTWDPSLPKAEADDWLRIHPDRKVNHFDLFDSSGRSHAAWRGCVEARPFPLDELDTPPGGQFFAADYNAARVRPAFPLADDTTDEAKQRISAAWTNVPTHSPKMTTVQLATKSNTRFVPWFYPDDPACRGNTDEAGTNDCNFSSSSGWHREFATTTNSSWPRTMFDDPKYDDYHRRTWYQNRGYVPDQKFMKANDGRKEANRAFWHLLMRYRSVYAREFNDDGTRGAHSAWAASNRCGTSLFSMPYDAATSSDMAWAIEKFDARLCTSRDYALRQAYVGYWDALSGTYKGKYEYDTGYGSGSDNAGTGKISGQGPNNGCVTPLLPLTNVKADVWSKVDSLEPAGSTNTAIGAVWGWRVLSPGAPFTEGTDQGVVANRHWRKVAVLMTDGQNTFPASYTHNLSMYTPYGYGSEDRLNLNAANPRSAYWVQQRYMSELDQKTLRVCHRMRAQGITVYTIGFAIEAGSSTALMLEACAVDPNNFFLAQNASELKDRFGKITDAITELHISN